MRTRVASGAAALILTTLVLPVFASAFTFSRTLCVGDTGTAVASLQQFLIDDADGNTDAGVLSEGDEAQAAELEVRIMIENRQFQAAKDLADNSYFLPRRVSSRLLEDLARA